MASKKHWTAITPQKDIDKSNRYTFRNKPSGLLESHTRESIAKEIHFHADDIGLYSVRFSLDYNKLIASYGTGAVQIIDVKTEVPEYHVKPGTDGPNPIMCIRCIPGVDDPFLAGGIDGNIYACKFEENSSTTFARETSNEIYAMDVDLDGTTLASGGKDTVIRIYDLNTGKLKNKLSKSERPDDTSWPTNFHKKKVFAIKYHPTDRDTFLSGGWDNCLKIWDVRQKYGCVKEIEGPHICGDAIDVKDHVILTGSWTAENSLQTWDLRSSKLIGNIVPINREQTLDGEFIFCCQFAKSPIFKDTIVAGGSGTGYLDVISITDEKIVNSFRTVKGTQTLHTDDFSKIAFGGMEPVIRLAHIV